MYVCTRVRTYVCVRLCVCTYVRMFTVHVCILEVCKLKFIRSKHLRVVCMFTVVHTCVHADDDEHTVRTFRRKLSNLRALTEWTVFYEKDRM